ncbi:hypothetical protein VFPPC_03846 [Pochonia chlamydosporia 170]|uniref:Uncharacterized protein n=1 Tax=Pochonia chlamydosporia 170 TaxID=1380566 RepID=A0A179F2S1_METCM|nr:hypothetical protein VFPPC_03846 [Pochonia chlamydosporia 170]OAQ59630.1 hypothetical protein VFPPC_03846 [Pochonia chlamydosporia 170]
MLLSGPGTEIIHNIMQNFCRLNQFRGSRCGGLPANLLELLARFRYSACGDPRDEVFAPVCLASEEAMDFISPGYRQQSLRIVNELLDISIIPGETLATSFFRTQVADIRHDAYSIVRGRYNATDWTEIMSEHSKLSDVDWHAQAGESISLNRTNQVRKLRRTSKNTIALVPCPAPTGDEIFALLGSQVLYVLRRRGNRGRRYEFIGECYVHGMMDGEAVPNSLVIHDVCLV